MRRLTHAFGRAVRSHRADPHAAPDTHHILHSVADLRVLIGTQFANLLATPRPPRQTRRIPRTLTPTPAQEGNHAPLHPVRAVRPPLHRTPRRPNRPGRRHRRLQPG